MWGGLIGFLPYFYVLLGDNTAGILATLAFVNIVTTVYLGPSIAVSHTLVPPAMRAMTSAILFFVLNMIGLGLGPLLTGILSDSLAATYGADSLRYAMAITAAIGGLGLVMFYLGAKQLPRDLARAASQKPAD